MGRGIVQRGQQRQVVVAQVSSQALRCILARLLLLLCLRVDVAAGGVAEGLGVCTSCNKPTTHLSHTQSSYLQQLSTTDLGCCCTTTRRPPARQVRMRIASWQNGRHVVGPHSLPACCSPGSARATHRQQTLQPQTQVCEWMTPQWPPAPFQQHMQADACCSGQFEAVHAC